MFGRKKREREAEALKSQLQLRETLFGDTAVDAWPHPDAAGPLDGPWISFAEARKCLAAQQTEEAKAHWRSILDTPGLEARMYLQAWHFLRQRGEMPPPEEKGRVLGVVVERWVGNGLDLLAGYADHSARYWNYSGAGIVWDVADPAINAHIDHLLEVGSKVVELIGVDNNARPGVPPPKGHMRLLFLTPGGIPYGQGPPAELEKDPKGAAVISAATALMLALMEKNRQSQEQ